MDPRCLAWALLAAPLLSGCLGGGDAKTDGQSPHYACPDYDLDPGTYILGAVWRDGKPMAGAAAYAHGPNGTTVEGDAGETGCFVLSLPEPGHWEGEARYDEDTGSFAVDVASGEQKQVVVELA